MTLAPPKLDTRSFDEILTEARDRIARYTPEYTLGWTDHNESDPGVTLLQLFAWLSQVTMERVNQLPERAYRALLDLVGIDVEPAVPAEADLVFAPIPGVSLPISVPAATQVGAPPADDGSPVVFETMAPLDVAGCELNSVLTYDGTTFRDVTPQNAETGEPIHPFGRKPEISSALYFGFGIPASPETGWSPFPGRVSLRAFEPVRSDSPSPVRVGAGPPSAESQIVWEYLPAEDADWVRLQIYDDETGALSKAGFLSLEGPAAIEPSTIRDVSKPHYWLRLRLLRPEYGGRTPTVDFFRFNVVRARHQVTVRGELLGTSDGSPNQKLLMQFRPIVPNTLRVEIQLPSGDGEVWQQVDFFRPLDPDDPGDLTAGPDARVFQLDLQEGTVSFGDGYRGAIPPAGFKIIGAEYQYGGGKAGNVEVATITSLHDTLGGIRGVENPRRSTGGRDSQSVDEALRSAPLRLRRRKRAVTSGDYQSAAEEVGGVTRAHVIPLAHPAFPGIDVPGAVTVLVVPDTDVTPPRPNETLLSRVARALEDQRMLTAEVYVRSPIFVKVEIWADLLVDPNYALGAAKEKALARLGEFLSPKSWTFGRNLYPASIFHELLELRDEFGIKAVDRLEIRVDNRQHPSQTEAVRIPADVLVYPGDHRLRMRPYQET